MKRLLLLLKPFSVSAPPPHTHPQILHFLDSRRKVHHDTINFCEAILKKKSVEWKAVPRNNLSQPINEVDLVVTVGGDGTLLQASHFMDDKIPVLGVNSDPTRIDEVEQFSSEFDASRSTGHLCAATAENFEQVLDGILEDQIVPSKLTRIKISVNAGDLSTYALNDILVAHPCPAALSRFSFRIMKDGQPGSRLVNCRSSGLRVSTAAGSTAAMLSAGGFPMPILSQDLQYMVREPISPGAVSDSMHGLIKDDDTLNTNWSCGKGVIYIDGSHINYTVEDGDIIEISSKAPSLKVFLPDHLL
ncbi:NADH kinase-like [Lotus japonicus]|uniref:NADH kinase-like n=1 Tax=Lotus japonicus TaxID=34305 RepID=UPI002582FAAA|nr:NADH kinase-like [Lotus japonicus]